MALEQLSVAPICYIALVCLLLFSFVQRFLTRDQRLKNIPGPWLARYSYGRRAYRSWRLDPRTTKENWQMKVLRKYGDVVRVGPDMVLVNDPEAIPIILGFKERLEKVCLHLNKGLRGVVLI